MRIAAGTHTGAQQQQPQPPPCCAQLSAGAVNRRVPAWPAGSPTVSWCRWGYAACSFRPPAQASPPQPPPPPHPLHPATLVPRQAAMPPPPLGAPPAGTAGSPNRPAAPASLGGAGQGAGSRGRGAGSCARSPAGAPALQRRTAPPHRTGRTGQSGLMTSCWRSKVSRRPSDARSTRATPSVHKAQARGGEDTPRRRRRRSCSTGYTSGVGRPPRMQAHPPGALQPHPITDYRGYAPLGKSEPGQGPSPPQHCSAIY